MWSREREGLLLLVRRSTDVDGGLWMRALHLDILCRKGLLDAQVTTSLNKQDQNPTSLPRDTSLFFWKEITTGLHLDESWSWGKHVTTDLPRPDFIIVENNAVA